ncbi:MAG TPA: GNAT family N-acetyltransferase [Euzebyales bacterium]|nr:GNAT family N-acetyltransferase [Euzebyales bacterium]
MTDGTLAPVDVAPVRAQDPPVGALLAALDAELDEGGYTPDQQFGYDVRQLVAAGVHLVGATRDGRLVGIAGVEVSDAHAELKRCYVDPAHRGSGVADALLAALVAHASAAGARVLRLETGSNQHAALGFYRRHGFRDIPRFGPYVDSETSVCMARDLHPGAPDR